MPIRLNLLAEAQAAEEMRRRDPVKRLLWVAGILIAAMLTWSGWLQLKAMFAKNDLNRVVFRMSSHTNEYQKVSSALEKTQDIKRKLSALHQLAANRFLNGSLLDALQHTTVDDVQLLRVKIEQAYSSTEEMKSRTNEAQIVIRGRPATANEKILITLEGIDSAPVPGDQINHFKEAVAANPWFRAMTRTNAVSLKNLSPPQISPLTGKPSVTFTLECRLPEKTR